MSGIGGNTGNGVGNAVGNMQNSRSKAKKSLCVATVANNSNGVWMLVVSVL